MCNMYIRPDSSSHLRDPIILALFSANSSAGNPGKNLIESFVAEAALGGCILDREPDDVWRRSGGGGGGGGSGGIGDKSPAAAAAAAAYLDSWDPLRWRPDRNWGS